MMPPASNDVRHLKRRDQSAEAELEVLAFIKRERHRFALPRKGTVMVGRSSECDIRLDHRSVSRQHLLIHVTPTGLEVEDISSRNGTWLFPGGMHGTDLPEETMNSGIDRRLEPNKRVNLTPGDMLRAGSVLLRLQRRSPSTFLELDGGDEIEHDAIVIDPAMRAVYEMAARVAESAIAVLILGETGVGKDVMAHTIHQRSLRSRQPFVRINCAALSPNLLESELFGHQRGAFTGAIDAKEGLLESANGGSVFLDEIGELPLQTQVKLLNVLESNEVLRVGATRATRIDVRFIAATNRDLAAEVRRGAFRKDLYFRINAINIQVPPLRQRPLDIEPLGRFFLRRFCERSNIPVPEISMDALTHMREYPWPGNVRELRNAMERAPLLCGIDPIRASHLPAEIRSEMFEALDDEATDLWSAPTTVGLRPSGIDLDPERQRVVDALRSCGGNQTRAAKMLGISRRTLVNRLNEFGLPRPRKRSRD